MNNNKILVSVCVITYNSEKYILETLESIKAQTYENIELIVSDDCSKDRTVEIVGNWIKENSMRFVNTKLLTVSNNTGVTGNCNRAYKVAKGDYIKDIGGDDLLCPHYIESCVNYMNEKKDVGVLFTEVELFSDEEQVSFNPGKFDYFFFNYNFDERKKYLINTKMPHLPTPASFYRAEVIKNLGFFDERIPMWEDGPMYHKLIMTDTKISLLKERLVKYRMSSDSITHTEPLSNKASMGLYYKYYIFPEIKYKKPLYAYLKYLKTFFIINYKNPICLFLYKVISKIG